jgi:hypothetical protein
MRDFMAYINHFLNFELAIQFLLKEDEMDRACSTNGGEAECI